MDKFKKLAAAGLKVRDLPVDEKGLKAWIERHSADPLLGKLSKPDRGLKNSTTSC